MKTDQITAVLLNARRDGDRISGNVYCDRKGRFRDGEIVTTSTVLDELGIPGGCPVIVTKNSIYKIGSWA